MVMAAVIALLLLRRWGGEPNLGQAGPA